MTRTYRVEWVPGSDRLHGRCWCGRDTVCEGPIEMWEWLLDHERHAAPAQG